jgi:hypothetical protein
MQHCGRRGTTGANTVVAAVAGYIRFSFLMSVAQMPAVAISLQDLGA